MATIQIADKPTVDAIKALLESSGGVKGYPNVRRLNTVSPSGVSITGKGRVTIIEPDNSAKKIAVTIDGVLVAGEGDKGFNMNPRGFCKFDFEKSFKVSSCYESDTKIIVLVQLAD